jgi:hypothetical protein
MSVWCKKFAGIVFILYIIVDKTNKRLDDIKGFEAVYIKGPEAMRLKRHWLFNS